MTEMNFVTLGDDTLRIEARGKFSDKDAADYVPNSESEQLRIDVPAFEGPLDLLLHLIRKHSMDIFDIPIVLITQKYVEAIEEMADRNLDVAGEFLLMAATLAQIKSRMLLPPEEQQSEAEEDGLALDPRAELVRRLLEYQKYKEVAAQLQGMTHLGLDVFARTCFSEADMIKDVEPEGVLALEPVEAFDLVDLFAKILESAKPKFAHSITMERVSVRARMNEMIELCRMRELLNFEDALMYFQAKSKLELIVTFLAILEMVRLKLLRVAQDHENGGIALIAVKENLWVDQDELLQDLQDLDDGE